jgi:hypothetical protein
MYVLIQYPCILPTAIIYGFCVILRKNNDYFLKIINQLIYVMENGCFL